MPRLPRMTVGYLETSVLYCDDNLARLTQFPDGCVDLIYLDPVGCRNPEHASDQAY